MAENIEIRMAKQDEAEIFCISKQQVILRHTRE